MTRKTFFSTIFGFGITYKELLQKNSKQEYTSKSKPKLTFKAFQKRIDCKNENCISCFEAYNKPVLYNKYLLVS